MSICKRLEPRLQTRLPAAVEFAQKFWGFEPPSTIRVAVGMPTVDEYVTLMRRVHINRTLDSNAHFSEGSARFVAAILRLWESRLNLTNEGICYGGSHVIHISTVAALLAPDHRLRPLLIHEITHDYQADTELKRMAMHGSFYSRAVAAVAEEGLSMLADKEARKAETSSLFGKARGLLTSTVKTMFAVFLRPIETIKRLGNILLSGIPEQLTRQLGRVLDNNPSLSWLVWPYDIGYKFADAVRQKVGGPAIAFELICNNPPNTFREVFDPDLYVANRMEAICALTATK